MTEDRARLWGKTQPPAIRQEFRNPVVIVLAVVSALLCGIAVHNTTRSAVSGLTVGLLCLWPGFLFSFLLLSIIGLPIRFVWCRLQPDHEAFVAYAAARRFYGRRLYDWLRTQEIWWRSLDGRTFENEVAKLLRDHGYQVQHTGKSGDKGVDILIAKGEDRVIVQCKAHKKPVGPAAVRELYGTLTDRGEDHAWLISSSGFTKGAREFAQYKPIHLISIEDLLLQGNESQS